MAEKDSENQPLNEAENKTRARLADFSGLDPGLVLKEVGFLIPVANQIVVFPDLGPTEPGMVPTGSVTEFDLTKCPEWLRFVGGADMGCGMSFALLDCSVTEKDFVADQKTLDHLHGSLQPSDSTGPYLGKGNHFIDFAVNGQGRIAVVVHTGSPGDQHQELGQLVLKLTHTGKLAAGVNEYLTKYQEVINSAEENRRKILALIAKLYGKLEAVSDLPHNTLDLEANKGFVRVYKGSINIQGYQERLLLPSSMGQPMILYYPGVAVGESSLWGVPHGTGRKMARGKVPKQEVGRVNPLTVNWPRGRHLMTPSNSLLPATELPDCYRPLEAVEKIMEENGLLEFKKENELEYLDVIAYIGH